MPNTRQPGHTGGAAAATVVPGNPRIFRPGGLMRLARAGARTSAVRAVYVVLAILPLAALLSACQCGGADAADSGGPVTVGVVPGIDNAPLRVAVSEGLFRKQG